MNRFFLLLIGSSIFLLACNREQPDNSDFDAFYQRFLTDSLYQMAHIQFPLEGIPNNAQHPAELEQFRWQKEKWRMHRPFDPDSTGFRSEFSTFGDELIIERIEHESGEYGMERRFTRQGDGWYLIYYAGLNPFEQ